MTKTPIRQLPPHPLRDDQKKFFQINKEVCLAVEQAAIDGRGITLNALETHCLAALMQSGVRAVTEREHLKALLASLHPEIKKEKLQ